MKDSKKSSTTELWDELTDAELEHVAGGASEQTKASTSDYGGCCCEGGYTATDDPPACCCQSTDAAPSPAFDDAALG
ncbi:MAG: hypothetical protein H6712_23165 [Myxococcales bacterium]|nr:hypothetical protein [Myxococcales bacterium]MCB9716777.1 hypothetical protein [Myxococcales bacterium]